MRDDPRFRPAYTIAEAAHYLGMPITTVRSWVRGQPYKTSGVRRFFKPVIHTPAENALSFINFVELHVLAAITRQFRIPLQKVRKSLDYLARHSPSPHPLAVRDFETNGLDIFVRQAGHLIAVSDSGQLAIRRVLDPYLKRIVRAADGLPSRLYLFTARPDPAAPKSVVLDPRISFGRPVLAGTGVPTAVIAERYKAGESVDALAKDYRRSRSEIEEAIRCELSTAAA